MKDKRVAIIGLLVTIILVCVILAFFFSTDRTGPVITVDQSLVKPYAASQGEDVLKSYAKAIDKADGDVSDTIMIENIYVMTDMNSAKVVYTARDKKNNITKYNFIIDYIPSSDELNAKNRSGSKEAETKADQPTTANAQKESTTAVTTAAATKEAEEGTTKEGAPALTLSSKEATIKAGTTFYISKYVDTIKDDSDSMADLSKRILVKGDYDTKTAGDYTLDVYCTDSQKNESNHVKFILHVN